MKFNINAPVFWAFCSLVAYLVFQTTYAALVGLAIGLGVSLVTTMVTK